MKIVAELYLWTGRND